MKDNICRKCGHERPIDQICGWCLLKSDRDRLAAELAAERAKLSAVEAERDGARTALQSAMKSLSAVRGGRAIEMIASERKRQIEKEGWSSEDDDDHDLGELAQAAACYALPQSRSRSRIRLWPWDRRWFKPTPDNRIRELVKAGALIVAEIERLQRDAEFTQTWDPLLSKLERERK